MSSGSSTAGRQCPVRHGLFKNGVTSTAGERTFRREATSRQIDRASSSPSPDLRRKSSVRKMSAQILMPRHNVTSIHVATSIAAVRIGHAMAVADAAGRGVSNWAPNSRRRPALGSLESSTHSLLRIRLCRLRGICLAIPPSVRPRGICRIRPEECLQGRDSVAMFVLAARSEPQKSAETVHRSSIRKCPTSTRREMPTGKQRPRSASRDRPSIGWQGRDGASSGRQPVRPAAESPDCSHQFSPNSTGPTTHGENASGTNDVMASPLIGFSFSDRSVSGLRRVRRWKCSHFPRDKKRVRPRCRQRRFGSGLSPRTS